jgi:hypothetical protein
MPACTWYLRSIFGPHVSDIAVYREVLSNGSVTCPSTDAAPGNHPNRGLSGTGSRRWHASACTCTEAQAGAGGLHTCICITLGWGAGCVRESEGVQTRNPSDESCSSTKVSDGFLRIRDTLGRSGAFWGGGIYDKIRLGLLVRELTLI